MEAQMAWSDFREVAQLRLTDPVKYRLPRGFDLEFADVQTDEERAIKSLIDQYRAKQTTMLETEIFVQCKRQAEAERKLAAKQTKASAESMRMPASKCSRLCASCRC